MRLLNVDTLLLEEFNDDDRPKYAILSHRWEKDEVAFRDYENGTASTKEGFHKLRMACKQAAKDGLSHIWIDTCCIDKSSSAELSEAINSMFRWYAESERCYAYLYDVSGSRGFVDQNARYEEFHKSVWFGRSWTLQELIAPTHVVFFDQDWNESGTKATLKAELEKITKIPIEALENQPLSEFSVGYRMSWASRRTATRREDVAYSLMGIFDVNMPMLYGEGDKAFRRLQEEIIKRTTDRSVLLWNHPRSQIATSCDLFARSPADYNLKLHGTALNLIVRSDYASSFTLGNAGLEISVSLIRVGVDSYLAPLARRETSSESLGLFLRLSYRLPDQMAFVRTGVAVTDRFWFADDNLTPQQKHNIIICPPSQSIIIKPVNGFVINDFQNSLTKLRDNLYIKDVQIQGKYVEEEAYWSLNDKFDKFETDRAWVCCIQLLCHNPKKAGPDSEEVSSLYLGFDFWSNPFCFYWQHRSVQTIMHKRSGPSTFHAPPLNEIDLSHESFATESFTYKVFGKHHDRKLWFVQSCYRTDISHTFGSTEGTGDHTFRLSIKRAHKDPGRPWVVTLTNSLRDSTSSDEATKLRRFGTAL